MALKIPEFSFKLTRGRSTVNICKKPLPLHACRWDAGPSKTSSSSRWTESLDVLFQGECHQEPFQWSGVSAKVEGGQVLVLTGLNHVTPVETAQIPDPGSWILDESASNTETNIHHFTETFGSGPHTRGQNGKSQILLSANSSPLSSGAGPEGPPRTTTTRVQIVVVPSPLDQIDATGMNETQRKCWTTHLKWPQTDALLFIVVSCPTPMQLLHRLIVIINSSYLLRIFLLRAGLSTSCSFLHSH